MGGVYALILYFSMQANNFFNLTTSPLRAALFRGKSSLRVCQLLPCPGAEELTLMEFPVTGGNKIHYPEVDPDLPAHRRQRLRRYIGAVHVHPPPSSFAFYRDCLWGSGVWTVVVRLDFANAKQSKTPFVWFDFPAGPVLPLQGIETLRRLETGESGRLAVLHPAKESDERSIEAL
jgi:hypothetical protein